MYRMILRVGAVLALCAASGVAVADAARERQLCENRCDLSAYQCNKAGTQGQLCSDGRRACLERCDPSRHKPGLRDRHDPPPKR